MASGTDRCTDETECLDTLYHDFQYLHELKSFLIEELNSFQAGTLELGHEQSYDCSKGLLRKFSDGRTVRTLLPHGHEWTYNTLLSPKRALVQDSQLWFVGFFSEQRKDQMPEIPTLVSNIQHDLDEELQEYPSMLSVCFAETKEGHWYNLVLMSGEQTTSQWKSSRLHRFAVR